MSGTYRMTVDERGRLVLPAAVRARNHLTPGTTLTLLETPDGLVLITRLQLQARVRRDLEGADLVSDLLAERRAAADEEERG